jgi:hypothetical protein
MAISTQENDDNKLKQLKYKLLQGDARKNLDEGDDDA